jgi:thioester reductase-like protein
MTTRVRVPSAQTLAARLLELTASVLHVAVDELASDPKHALRALDSVNGLELIAAIEDEFGIRLPDTTFLECRTLDELVAFVERRLLGGHPERSEGSAAEHRFVRMRADAELPPDIVPSRRSPSRPVRRVLLTGATGFVGAYVLRELVRATSASVVCLVRQNGGRPLDRVRNNLEQYGIWSREIAARVECIEGDLEQPLIGLETDDFHRLADRVDAVYHAAAAVDWVQSYEGLRDVNVIGTRELLRLACHGSAKPFHYLSSLAVCFSTHGRREMDEHDDPLADIAGLHLGYAQSKCVAEALTRSAGHRGLPVTIARPALIVGDSTSGASNPDDLVSLLIRGCIYMRAAPDLDWVMDVVPVDHAARVIVGLNGRRESHSGPQIVHVSNPAARHWRECVLWMRVRGYPLELLPYRDWAELARQSATSTAHPLFPLRPFFTRRLPEEGGCFLPELYEEDRRRAVRHDRSRSTIAQLGAPCPAVDAALLGRYFESYTARGVIPPLPTAARQRRELNRPKGGRELVQTLEHQIATHLEPALRLRSADPELSVADVSLTPMGGDSSIVAELTSWRRVTQAGLRRARITTRLSNGTTQGVDLVVKSKPSDADVIDVGEHVARLSSRRLGEAYSTWRHDIGFTRGHLRELAIARLPDAGIRNYSPDVLASWSGDGDWILAMEHVGDAFVADAYDRAWTDGEIEPALRGLAHIHATWYGRTRELVAAPWLPPLRSAASMAAMHELWRAASDNAAGFFMRCGGEALVHSQRTLVDDVERWWSVLERQPQTLIHNDFNPRNVMLRGTVGDARLCAYDWELATIGAPQRDLAEFLCFVLTTESANRAPWWIDRYRQLLQGATNTPIDPETWDVGFRAALCDVGLDRIPMYAMVHRFRPQAFLPRVTSTWFALHRALPWSP